MPPILFGDMTFDTVDRPAKRKPRYPYLHQPQYFFLKTLNRRYWGKANVFFKRLKPILARHEAALDSSRINLKVTIKFEMSCANELTQLTVQNAPNDAFIEDIRKFLTSAQFRWLKCRSPYPDKFEFEVLLSR